MSLGCLCCHTPRFLFLRSLTFRTLATQACRWLLENNTILARILPTIVLHYSLPDFTTVRLSGGNVASTQSLFYFSFRSFRKHQRTLEGERTIPVRWRSINPPRFLFFIMRARRKRKQRVCEQARRKVRVTSECASWLARGTRRGGRGARGTKIPEGSNPCNGLYGGGGGSARKGNLFQPSGKWKGRDFTCWSI